MNGSSNNLERLAPGVHSLATPQSNLVPMVLERTAGGERAFDVYSNLLQKGVVFLTGGIDDNLASVIKAQLFYLGLNKSQLNISRVDMLIDSPGGSITAGMGIHDTMRLVEAAYNLPVRTICVGQAASMGAFLLASGSPGQRMASLNSRILIHQPLMSGLSGQASDIQIQAREIDRMKRTLNELFSLYSGKPVAQITEDVDRDNILMPEQCTPGKYGYKGLIDEVLLPEHLSINRE